jgi:excisionase family DNA binding protein
MNDLPDRPALTIQEAAKLLGISKSLAYAAAASGALPAIRIGGRLIVPRAKLAKMLGGEAAANVEA